MSRFVVVMISLLLGAADAAGQPNVSQPSRTQREMLRQIVAAVDTAAGEPETPGATWQVHVLRASDGSHYVAFSVDPPALAKPLSGAVMLYVRLATASASGRGVEQSAVADWLAGRRSDPMLRPRTGFVIGEMPLLGSAGLMDPNRGGRAAPVPQGSNDLRLMQLERDRAKQEKEERERQRRAELEGNQPIKRELLPFEDFDLAANASASGALQRAFTSGPGDFELYIAWADPAARQPAAVQVLKRSLHLPPTSATELEVSAVIIAESVAVRTAPYPTTEQAAHPYAIGLTEITPRRDAVFSRDDRLNVTFQVINARPSEAGKPDVGITMRIVRVTGDREQPVAALNPLQYTAETMPANFDLRLGHPIFAAMSAPLATLSRGSYRLKIAVNDRISGRGTTGEAEFTVTGTPASLLAEAPPLGAPFRREMALTPAVIEEVVAQLTPESPSPQLARALATLRQRQFVELMREEPVPSRETGLRTALTAVARFALGDASSTVQFQRAMLLEAPAAPSLFFVGAGRALEGRDADALTAWQAALEGGMPAPIVNPLLINLYLRRSDVARATALLDTTANTEWSRERVALQIAGGRERDAIPTIEARLTSAADDTDAEWLLLHALYASLVHALPAKPEASTQTRFIALAEAYVAKDKPNAALVTEWMKAIRQ